MGTPVVLSPGKALIIRNAALVWKAHVMSALSGCFSRNVIRAFCLSGFSGVISKAFDAVSVMPGAGSPSMDRLFLISSNVTLFCDFNKNLLAGLTPVESESIGARWNPSRYSSALTFLEDKGLKATSAVTRIPIITITLSNLLDIIKTS
jgi:hypothetical protein